MKVRHRENYLYNWLSKVFYTFSFDLRQALLKNGQPPTVVWDWPFFDTNTFSLDTLKKYIHLVGIHLNTQK